MTIWCISKYANLPEYGAGARLYYLAEEFNRQGHEAYLITSDSNHLANFPETDKTYNFEKKGNVLLCWIKTKKYLKTASIERILSWFDFERKLFFMPRDKFNKPDVVIVSSLSIFSILYGYFLKIKYKSFLVFEIRDIWPLTMTEEGGFSKWHPLVLLIGWIEKFGYKKADLIVGTMPKLNLHVKNIIGYDKQFFCSPLGFKPDNYMECSEEEKNYFNNIFPKKKFIVGYAGSMGITNALESFIETIKELRTNKNIHFMLVGSGVLKQEFEKQLEDCSNVTFLQRLDQSKVKCFLEKCDLLYLSTQKSKIWEYGQSMNKVVEYMLAGKPIIASYSGFPSMINEAESGLFISSNSVQDVKKAILYYANMSEQERREFGERGKAWIYNNRSYELLAKQYLEKIKNIRNDM